MGKVGAEKDHGKNHRKERYVGYRDQREISNGDGEVRRSTGFSPRGSGDIKRNNDTLCPTISTKDFKKLTEAINNLQF